MGWGKPFSKKGWATNLAKIGAVAVGSIFGGPVGGALTGAAVGGMGGGGVKGAAIGGALGGTAGYLAGTGTAAGTPLAGGVGPTQGSGLAGLLSGGSSGGASGILSGIGAGMPSFLGGGSGSAISSAALPSDASVLSSSGIVKGMGGGGMGSLFGGGGMSSLLLPAASIFSGFQQSNTIEDIEKQKMEAENRRLALLAPYNESGQAANRALAEKLASGELGGKFNALDLSSDPVYQAELAQGEQAMGRKQAATGNIFSGQAMKEAAKYSQDLAQQKQNEAYNRWLGQQQNTYNQYAAQASQGMNAAAGVGNIYSGMGDITAGATGAQSNNLNATLAALLSGAGRQNQPKFDAYGNLIYG